MYSNKRDDATDGFERNQNAHVSALPPTGVAIADVREAFVAQIRCRDAGPVIVRFRAALMSIQADELKRLYNRLPALDEPSRQAIGQFAECLVETMLGPPLECLENECGNGASQELVNALQQLFQLET